MRIRQYVYFAVRSETTPAAAITALLRMEADRISVRGSRQAEPPRPVCHMWAIECRAPGLAVDEQIADVLGRVRPIAGPLRELVAAGDVSTVLQIVRDFDAEDGEEEHHETRSGDGGVTLRTLDGQHQLLGWHLAAADLAFLVEVAADIDVDEYS